MRTASGEYGVGPYPINEEKSEQFVLESQTARNDKIALRNLEVECNLNSVLDARSYKRVRPCSGSWSAHSFPLSLNHRLLPFTLNSLFMHNLYTRLRNSQTCVFQSSSVASSPLSHTLVLSALKAISPTCPSPYTKARLPTPQPPS